MSKTLDEVLSANAAYASSFGEKASLALTAEASTMSAKGRTRRRASTSSG